MFHSRCGLHATHHSPFPSAASDVCTLSIARRLPTRAVIPASWLALWLAMSPRAGVGGTGCVLGHGTAQQLRIFQRLLGLQVRRAADHARAGPCPPHYMEESPDNVHAMTDDRYIHAHTHTHTRARVIGHQSYSMQEYELESATIMSCISFIERYLCIESICGPCQTQPVRGGARFGDCGLGQDWHERR